MVLHPHKKWYALNTGCDGMAWRIATEGCTCGRPLIHHHLIGASEQLQPPKF